MTSVTSEGLTVLVLHDYLIFRYNHNQHKNRWIFIASESIVNQFVVILLGSKLIGKTYYSNEYLYSNI